MKLALAVLLALCVTAGFYQLMPRMAPSRGLKIKTATWIPNNGVDQPRVIPFGVSLAVQNEGLSNCCSGKYRVTIDVDQVARLKELVPGP